VRPGLDYLLTPRRSPSRLEARRTLSIQVDKQMPATAQRQPQGPVKFRKVWYFQPDQFRPPHGFGSAELRPLPASQDKHTCRKENTGSCYCAALANLVRLYIALCQSH
jgi:hypothetical protein